VEYRHNYQTYIDEDDLPTVCDGSTDESHDQACFEAMTLSTLVKTGKLSAFRKSLSFGTHIRICCSTIQPKSQQTRGIMANIHTPIPTVKLNDGTSMPMIAYGTGTAWSKGRRPGSDIDRALVDSVKLALAMGYRHIDCAESTSAPPYHETDR
jgi:hypothetical protein